MEGFLFVLDIYIQNNNMYKNFILTESEKEQIIKMHQKHGYKKPLNESHDELSHEEVDESYWNKIFGSPTIKDAAHDSLRGQGHSHTGKDDSNELYVVFQGQNFYPSDIEYADANDMGEIPRIEDGKLIVANPSWSL